MGAKFRATKAENDLGDCDWPSACRQLWWAAPMQLQGRAMLAFCQCVPACEEWQACSLRLYHLPFSPKYLTNSTSPSAHSFWSTLPFSPQSHTPPFVIPPLMPPPSPPPPAPTRQPTSPPTPQPPQPRMPSPAFLPPCTLRSPVPARAHSARLCPRASYKPPSRRQTMISVSRRPGFGAAEELDLFLRQRRPGQPAARAGVDGVKRAVVDVLRGARTVVHPAFDAMPCGA